MTSKITLLGTALAVLVTVGLLVGCGDSASQDSKKPTVPAARKTVKPLLQKKEIADWCPEHGVPESICTRCNDTLIAGFKAKGDWCNGHDLPESQCFDCNPALEAAFKARAPGAAGAK